MVVVVEQVHRRQLGWSFRGEIWGEAVIAAEANTINKVFSEGTIQYQVCMGLQQKIRVPWCFPSQKASELSFGWILTGFVNLF